MPFDGNGNYSLPTPSYPAVPGAVITAEYRNTIDEDLANALSNVLCRDGQSAATANISIGGFKLTNLAAGALAGDAIRFEQLFGVAGPATAAAARANLGAIGNLTGIQKITATGTYTPTVGTKAVLVELVGGGGAGGGCQATGASSYAAGSGGGAGGFASSFLTDGFSGVTVTVGAGGNGVAGASGGSGGTTSFGALLSATGGAGGNGGSAISLTAFSDIQTNPGGACGIGSGSNILNSRGAPGYPGLYVTRPQGGGGGASQFGGGAPGNANIGGTGPAASSPGAGGGGCSAPPSTAASTGGAGGAGLCVIYEFA